MLKHSDVIESVSRTLRQLTPPRMQSLVHEITSKLLPERPFRESDLKMNDIRMIEESTSSRCWRLITHESTIMGETRITGCSADPRLLILQ